jgi:RNA polymerase sigma-70 factor (ECF subfamily)
MAPRAGVDSATRQSLITRLKDWDNQESWREFFDTYWPLIHRVAMAAGLSDAEAQDVVQDTIIEVAGKMKEFKYDPAKQSFRGWLLTRLRWRIRDYLRRRQRSAVRRESHSERSTHGTRQIERVADPNSAGFTKVYEEQWKSHVMKAAIERVRKQASPRQFQIFDLCVLREWPVEKIVQSLGVTSNQVYVARHRVSEMVASEAKRLEKEML